MGAHPVRLVLLGITLGAVVLLLGCNETQDTPVPAAGAASGAGGSIAKPVKSGNTMDTTVYPAPPGVKTGIEGGKKN